MSRGKPPDSQELPALVPDVEYELEMLDHAVARWVSAKTAKISVREAELDEFGWMELSMLHARNLASFFANARSRDTDDVVATDWLPGWGSGEENAQIEELRSETANLNKWLMHITATRTRQRDTQPAFSPTDIQIRVHNVWSLFQARLKGGPPLRQPQSTAPSENSTTSTTYSVASASSLVPPDNWATAGPQSPERKRA